MYIFEIVYFIIVIASIFILTFSSDHVKYIKRITIFFISLTLVYGFFDLVIPFMPPAYPGFWLLLGLTVVVVSFGSIGMVLQEDKQVREGWKIPSAFSVLGSILMGFWIVAFLGPFITTGGIFLDSPGPYARPLGFSIYALSFFLFFISGFYASRNIRDLRGVKGKLLFSLSLLSVILSILDGILNITIKWPFLYFGYFGLYFGFFFIFQSLSFILRLTKADRISIGILMVISLFWVILAFFYVENFSILTPFPAIYPKLLFWLFIIGFIISFRYKIEIYY